MQKPQQPAPKPQQTSLTPPKVEQVKAPKMAQVDEIAVRRIKGKETNGRKLYVVVFRGTDEKGTAMETIKGPWDLKTVAASNWSTEFSKVNM